MQNRMKTMPAQLFRRTLLCSALSLGLVTVADACTRAVYLGAEQQIITARSMDWKDDIETNLWILPKGAQRTGATGENRLATLHLSISDATGDSAIVEYIGGKQVIHHDRNYQVMTNSTPNEPNISSTRWRTVVDHKNLSYFFESALSPNTFWVDVKNIDFNFDKQKAYKLDLGPNQSHSYAGEVSKQFVEHAPFEFLGV